MSRVQQKKQKVYFLFYHYYFMIFFPIVAGLQCSVISYLARFLNFSCLGPQRVGFSWCGCGSPGDINMGPPLKLLP